MEPSPCTPPHRELSKRHQEHNLNRPSSVDLRTTKQNKLPPYIVRLYHVLLARLGDDNWPFELGVGSFCLQRHLVGNKEEEDWFFCGWIR